MLMHPRHILRLHFPRQPWHRTLPHQDYPYVQARGQTQTQTLVREFLNSHHGGAFSSHININSTLAAAPHQGRSRGEKGLEGKGKERDEEGGRGQPWHRTLPHQDYPYVQAREGGGGAELSRASSKSIRIEFGLDPSTPTCRRGRAGDAELSHERERERVWTRTRSEPASPARRTLPGRDRPCVQARRRARACVRALLNSRCGGPFPGPESDRA